MKLLLTALFPLMSNTTNSPLRVMASACLLVMLRVTLAILYLVVVVPEVVVVLVPFLVVVVVRGWMVLLSNSTFPISRLMVPSPVTSGRASWGASSMGVLVSSEVSVEGVGVSVEGVCGGGVVVGVCVP